MTDIATVEPDHRQVGAKVVEMTDVEAGERKPEVADGPKADANVIPQGTVTTGAPKPEPPPGKYDYPPRQPPKYAISRGCPPPPCYKRKIGRFYVFVEAKDGRPLWIVGPCWPMYFFTLLLIAGATAAVLGGLARDVIAVCVVGAVLGFIVLAALTMTACRNPGIVERRQHRCEEGEIYDERALTYRPRNAMFEQETGTVIEDIDHFCPWTSTVIAKSNMFCFLVFTRTLCLLILFTIGVTIWGVSRLPDGPNG